MNLIGLLISTAIGRNILIAVAGVVCVWFALSAYTSHVEQRVREQIERQNQERVNDAGRAARNVADCYSVGGKWVQSKGRCVMPRLPSP